MDSQLWICTVIGWLGLIVFGKFINCLSVNNDVILVILIIVKQLKMIVNRNCKEVAKVSFENPNPIYVEIPFCEYLLNIKPELTKPK